MKQSRWILIALLLLTTTAAFAEAPRPVSSHAPDPVSLVAMARNGTLDRVLVSYYTPEQLDAGVYVGSEFCLACHKDFAGWRTTQHAFALIRPMTQWAMTETKGVVADMDGDKVEDFIEGLDFNKINSAFDKFKPNAPKLSVENGKYFITVGVLKMPVTFVRQWREADGTWLQRFAVKIPVSDSSTGYTRGNYLTIQYVGKEKVWKSDGIDTLYDANNQPKFTSLPTTAQVVASPAGGTFETCAGCHATGIKSYAKTSAGEWVMTPYVATLYNADDPAYFDYNGDGNFAMMNIGCESCHGPGNKHILGAGDKTKIVNPKNLTAAQQTDLCGQCHSRLKSLPNKTFSFPYKDDTMTQWVPGTPMEPFYADPGTSYWPDNKTPKSTHMEFIAVKSSIHFTNPFEKLSCGECHEPHWATGAGQLLPWRQNGTLTITTKADDNTLCLSCHATHGPFADITPAMVADPAKNVDAIGKVVSKHSNHPYAPERMMGLSRCIECHMPKAGVPPGGTDYLVHSHYFEATAPEKTLNYLDKGGMPNACAVACHNEKANVFDMGLDPTPTTWNGPFDITLAKLLQKYYGPGGTWWNTTPTPTASTAPSH